MRNPKTMLLLSVIMGVLLLGVAYAAIQNITLTINGTVTATPDQGNFKVKFTGTPRPTSTVSGHGVATLNITGDTTATMNVSNMTTAGDLVISEFTLINESTDLTAYLSAEVTHINTEYFEVTTTIGTAELAPSNTTVLTVIVRLIKTPIVEQTDTINVKLVASPTPTDSGDLGAEMVKLTIFRPDGVTDTFTLAKGTDLRNCSELEAKGYEVFGDELYGRIKWYPETYQEDVNNECFMIEVWGDHDWYILNENWSFALEIANS